MSSYLQPLTTLLTSTTSKYASIRRTLLSDESDGDTEDDTHISRALRAYYVEKGRPFPPWLPPDPKAKYAAYGQNVGQQYTQQSGPYGPHAQRYGGPATASAAGGARRGGGLSDLWDSGPSTSAPAQPQSLRVGRQPNAATAAATTVYSPGRNERLAPAGGRPLPSQREGSYQSLRSGRSGGGSLRATGSSSAASDDGSVGGRTGGSGAAPQSTQDRLKARLWSGRAGSPAGGGGALAGGGGGGNGY